MRMHFATIPVLDSGPAQAELNRFLASHRVLTVERHLVASEHGAVWAVCVSYTEGRAEPSGTKPPSGKKKPVDYRELLSEDDFRVFAQLRALRKTEAQREGIPAYAIFTNEQLAAIVRGRVRSVAALAKIEGVGKSRVEKYGPKFLAALREHERVDAKEGEHAAE